MPSMKSTLTSLTVAIAALWLLASLEVKAFATASSYSFIGFDALEDGISTNLNVGLISPSFTDMFSGFVMSSTRTEFRLLEGRQRVDAQQARRYVKERYAALPAALRDKLTNVLVQAKQADEDLKARMGAPKVSDETKILFAQERERLLSNVFLYEQQMQAAYLSRTKPKAAAELQRWLRDWRILAVEASLCDLGEPTSNCLESIGTGSASRHQNQEREKHTLQLLLAPLEVSRLDGHALTSFKEETNEHIHQMSSYISGLYSSNR